MQNKDFDFIVAGAGAAGLSLLVRMIRSGKFADKKILLVDKQQKVSNDRTWCFWEKQSGIFEELVFKTWKKISIYNNGFAKDIDISPYAYKMIRGIDFYRYSFELIQSQKNITIEYGEIDAVNENCSITVNGKTVSADYVFNSIRFNDSAEAKGKNNLLQHFTGWIIRSEAPAFNDHQATLMDFRTSQQHGCSFVYVMPFSKNTALVEYTLFSKKLLTRDQYSAALKNYLSEHYHGIGYTVESTEFGVIPMTDFPFPPGGRGLINIGTAGGQTKPSTGYTFQFIQKRTAEIVEALIYGNEVSPASIPAKYRFYDKVLLNVIATGKKEGSDVFTRLFEKNPSSRIFRFLDNESSLIDDIRLITTLPVMPFLRASFE